MIKLTGLKEFNKKLSRVSTKTNEYVSDELQRFGERVVIKAKRDHRYRSKSGNLRRSTRKKYKFSGKSHTVEIYLDKRMTTVTIGKYSGESYGVYQHEGTRHIKQDRFLTRAFKSELPRLKQRLRRIPSLVKRSI